jgi:hypothetical protein
MMKAHGIRHQLQHGSAERQGRSARRSGELRHNNGMHPTGMSIDVIRKVGCLSQCFPAGDAGRSVASH